MYKAVNAVEDIKSAHRSLNSRLLSARYAPSACTRLRSLRYETGRSHSPAWLLVKRSTDCDRAVSLWRTRRTGDTRGWRSSDGWAKEEGPRGFMVSNFYGVTNMRVPCHLYLQVQVAGH